MIKPKKLNKGDFIGVCAPSGSITKKHKASLLRTEQIFKSYSLNVVYSSNLFSQIYFFISLMYN